VISNLNLSKSTHRRYIIERRKIGSGGYGTCHRGLCLRTGQFVCVKRLKRTTGIFRKTCKYPTLLTISSGPDSIKRELDMLEEVQCHPANARSNNVVSLLDCVQKDDRTSLIFELVEGRNFYHDLPKFTELNVVRYMRELFIALAHVHRYYKCIFLPRFMHHPRSV
jgi:serine/threonine protein kinase